MKTLVYALVALALVLLAAPSRAPFAQTAGPQTSGAYTLYLGEQEAGGETYVMTIGADGTRRSEAEVAFGLNKSRAVTVTDAGGRPLSFTVETGGARVLSTEFASGAAKVSAQGQAPREVRTSATVIIENAVWHHFIYLLAQYDAARGGQQSFVGFLPSQSLEFSLRLERLASPSFDLKGQRVVVEHYRAVTSHGLVFEVWAEPSTRVPHVIRVPAQGVKVIRAGSESLAEALAPKAAAPGVAAAANEAFTGEEVSFEHGDVKLAGTLTLPKKGSVAPHAAVILISGSGGQDRDGSNVLYLYKRIAEHLSSNGVAVLRVDDRGTGKSVMRKLRPPSYRDLIGDTRAAFEYLLTRPDIDGKRVALAGHSEGALTALIIASEEQRVAAVALLAGTSRSVDRVAYEQALYMVALQETIDTSDEMKLPQVSRDLVKIFEASKTEPKPANADEDKYAWFREHAASDPSEIARHVRCPVLIMNGERDSQVLPYHALELARALSAGGNKHVRLRVFPNLTHLFTPSALDRSVTGDKTTEVSGEMLQTLQTWLTNVLAAGKTAR